MTEGIDRERENIEISIAAAKERIEECKRQAREADVREKQDFIDLRTAVTEATVEQRKLMVVFYIMLLVLCGIVLSMLVFGTTNQVSFAAAAFIGTCAFVYFLFLSIKGPYPTVSRQAEAERAKLALKKKNHVALLDEERRDAEETITFQTAALEDIKRRMAPPARKADQPPPA